MGKIKQKLGWTEYTGSKTYLSSTKHKSDHYWNCYHPLNTAKDFHWAQSQGYALSIASFFFFNSPPLTVLLPNNLLISKTN